MKRWRRWILVALAALVGLPVTALLLAVAAIAWFGVSIDASRWRGPLAVRASALLGMQVALDGPLEIELGRETAVHAGGLRILNPRGFEATDFATLGKVRARIDLLAALRGRLHVRSLEASDGHARLERATDGRANWTRDATMLGTAQPRGADAAPVVFEIESVTLRNFVFEHYDGSSGVRRVLAIDELTGTGKWSEPLTLALRGHAGSTAYTVRIDGGSAQLLLRASEAWPFTLDLEFLGTRLHASGALDAQAPGVRLEFGAGTEALEQVGQLLRVHVPNLGPAALTGRLLATPTRIEVADLHGVAGGSALGGTLALVLGGDRPRLSGTLSVATLDLTPFLDSGGDQRLTYDELVAMRLPLRDLVPLDVDLLVHLGVSRGLIVEIRDARVELHIDRRGMRAPVAGTIAGVPLSGRIDLDGEAGIPALALELNARAVPLNRLGANIDGRLDSLSIRLNARGETLGALVQDLAVRQTATGARIRYRNPSGGRPVEVALDAIELTAPRGRTLRATARGRLFGEPATLTVRAGTLPDLLREPIGPFALELTAAGATLGAEGVARMGAPGGADVAFRVAAKRAGTLGRWVGLSPESNLPLALRGRVRIGSDGWRFEDTTLKLGRSDLIVDAYRIAGGGTPVLVAAVRSTLIDITELQALRRNAPAPARRARKTQLGTPALWADAELTAADIGLALDRVVLPRGELADVAFGARVRDGRLAPSPFAARFGDVAFEGKLGADLRGAAPEVSLDMSTGRVDLGALLRRLGVVERLGGHADALQLKLVGRGASLEDVLAHSSFEARLLGGELSAHGPTGAPFAEIRVERATLTALPGKPLTIRIDGALDDIPVRIKVAAGTLADYARDTKRMPFSVDAEAAGARLVLAGEVALPLGRGGDVILEVGGERLDSLSPLARAALPPWQLWSVEGPISMTPTGYEVTKLAVRVGESRLYGRGRLDLNGDRPRVEVQLHAPRVQLDDFPIASQRVRQSVTAEALREAAGRTATRTQDLLSAAVLRRFDGYLDVAVDELLSGGDKLAAGMLRARLREGRLDIDPAQVRIPGGSATLSLSYDPTGDKVALAVSADVDRFDYGILLRRLRPGSDLGGLLSLRLALAGTAPSLSAFIAHASGHFDAAVWPKNLRGGVINRWSVNVFFALLPFIDSTPQAHVNCLIARMDLTNGILVPDALLIDTGRVRVFGTGRADFATEEIAFRFRPRVKGLVLFSLQPPVDVTGTMTNFRIGLARGQGAGTAVRFLTSVFVVPFQMLTRGPLPRDGADICTDPLR